LSVLGSLGAKDINIQDAETGWWLGRYDKEQKLLDTRSAESVSIH
jgi:hypothetical protein